MSEALPLVPPPQTSIHGSLDGSWSWRRGTAVFVASLAALTLLHFDALDSPPTKDQAMGLWMEANFLAESGYDYAALLQQPGEFQGGPRLYVISVLPTFLALLMKVTTTPQDAIFAYHVFTLACAAVVLAVVFELIRPATSTLIAVLCCGALATTPAFSVQVELCGMDVPLAAVVAVSAWWTLRGRLFLGAGSSLLAFLVKQSGIFVTAATLVAALWLVARPGNSAPVVSRGRAVVAALLCLVLLLAELIVFFSGISGLGRF
ncbi:MAG: hypothetical protein K2Y37_21370 [Pirellulales bacterium]|nr:hypothetical protein [Pirellulales bacterium]